MTDSGDHTTTAAITAAADALRALTIDEHATGRDVYHAMATLIEIRNLVDHQLAVHVAAADRIGLAKKQGRSTRELLIVMGLAPAVAQRLLRIARALESVGRVAGHAADGAIPVRTWTRSCAGPPMWIDATPNRSTSRHAPP